MKQFMYNQFQYLQPTSLSKEAMSKLFGITPAKVDAIIMHGSGDTLTTFKTKASRRARLLRRNSMSITKAVDFLITRRDSAKILRDALGIELSSVGPVMTLYSDGTALVFQAVVGFSSYNFFIPPALAKQIADGRASSVPTEYALATYTPVMRFETEIVDQMLATRINLGAMDKAYMPVSEDSDAVAVSAVLRNTFMIEVPPECLHVTRLGTRRMEIRGINGYSGNAIVTTTLKL